MAKAKAKRKKKPARDEFDEHVEGVEFDNNAQTVSDYLDGWRSRLNEIISRYKNEPQNSVRGKQVIDAQYALTQVFLIERGSVDVQALEAAVNLGISFERMSLRPVVPWIGRSPRVSKANAEKGRRSAALDDRQWGKVKKFIEGRPQGVSVAEACRQASKQLLTGAFSTLPRLRVEITGGALNRRWSKRKP